MDENTVNFPHYEPEHNCECSTCYM